MRPETRTEALERDAAAITRGLWLAWFLISAMVVASVVAA